MQIYPEDEDQQEKDTSHDVKSQKFKASTHGMTRKQELAMIAIHAARAKI